MSTITRDGRCCLTAVFKSKKARKKESKREGQTESKGKQKEGRKKARWGGKGKHNEVHMERKDEIELSGQKDRQTEGRENRPPPTHPLSPPNSPKKQGGTQPKPEHQ